MDKSCKTCFFGTIKDFKQAPCWNCKLDTRQGLEAAYSPVKWVSNSPEFWQDEPTKTEWPFPDTKENKMTESYQKDALRHQVAGDHYKDLAIQPVEYCHKNKLGPCESNIVKYITRWKAKGGKADLEKVRHYVDLLIQLEGL